MALHKTKTWKQSFPEGTVERLRDAVWLDNYAIDFYLASSLDALKTRELRDKIHVEDTSFFPLLMQQDLSGASLGGYSYEAIKARLQPESRRMKGKTLEEKEIILVPVHEEKVHWFLAVLLSPSLRHRMSPTLLAAAAQWVLVIVDPKSKHLSTWKKQNVVTPLKKLMKRENLIPTSSSLQVVGQVTGLPRQENDFDCGVFLCRYAVEILKDFCRYSSKKWFESANSSSLLTLIQASNNNGAQESESAPTPACFASLTQEAILGHRRAYYNLMDKWKREKAERANMWDTPAFKERRTVEMCDLVTDGAYSRRASLFAQIASRAKDLFDGISGVVGNPLKWQSPPAPLPNVTHGGDQTASMPRSSHPGPNYRKLWTEGFVPSWNYWWHTQQSQKPTLEDRPPKKGSRVDL